MSDTINRKFHFTKKSIDEIDPVNFPAKYKQLEYTDLSTHALSLLVYPSGKKVFYCRLNYKKKRYSLRLGEHPAVTLPQVRNQIVKIKALIAEGKDPKLECLREAMTFKQFALEYYIPHAKVVKKSYKSDISKLNNYLLPKFGKRLLHSITKAQIRNYHQFIYSKLSPATANKHLALCKAMFTYAVENEFLEQSVAKGIKTFKENNQRTRYLSEDECRRFITASKKESNQDAAQLFLLLLSTGMRLGEALNAKFEDFDETTSSLYLPETKSGMGRHVKLNDVALDIFTAQLKKHAAVGYVFHGKNINASMSRPARVFYRILKEAGIEGLRIHDLRHSFSSILIQNGAYMYELKTILGHSSIKVTERYAHLTNSSLTKATAGVADYLTKVIGRN